MNCTTTFDEVLRERKINSMRKRVYLILAVVAVTTILASVFTVATKGQRSGPVEALSYPTMAAHRGGLDLYPENTLTAFRQVRDNHAGQAVEFDVRALADGTLVVIHDATVNRTAANGATGAVKGMTRKQWGSLRIADPTGGSVPATTLNEVLDEFGGTGTVLIPELKDNTAVDQFIEALWPHRDQIIPQSFDAGVVSRLVRSGFHTLQLASTPTTLVDGVYALGIAHTAITPEVVDAAHREGATVWAWTVNNQNRIDELMGMQVDAVMTNDPRLEVT